MDAKSIFLNVAAEGPVLLALLLDATQIVSARFNCPLHELEQGDVGKLLRSMALEKLISLRNGSVSIARAGQMQWQQFHQIDWTKYAALERDPIYDEGAEFWVRTFSHSLALQLRALVDSWAKDSDCIMNTEISRRKNDGMYRWHRAYIWRVSIMFATYECSYNFAVILEKELASLSGEWRKT